ncbi:MAG: hypothetical protein JOY61_14085, partial [Chloroflexi bacterium]|nr:hypothetical protein [Chloroflexota bacterium]
MRRSRRWLPGVTFALVLSLLGSFITAQPVLPQAQPTPAVSVSCAPTGPGTAVFTLAATVSPTTTVNGTYTITPGGPTAEPFSLSDSSSVDVSAPAGSSLTATYTNPDGTTQSITGGCPVPVAPVSGPVPAATLPQVSITCTTSPTDNTVPIFYWLVTSPTPQTFSGTYNIDQGGPSGPFPLVEGTLTDYVSRTDFGAITGPPLSTLVVEVTM